VTVARRLLPSPVVGRGFGILGAQRRPGETDWTRAYDETARHPKTGGVPREFVARSHFPLLEYDAQVDLMQRLAEGVAPCV